VNDGREAEQIVRSALYSRWQEPPISEMTTRRVEMRRIAGYLFGFMSQQAPKGVDSVKG
jgi:hypothetical protein